MKKETISIERQVQEILKILPLIEDKAKELKELQDKENNIPNIGQIVYLCDVLSNYNKILDAFSSELTKLLNSQIYSNLPFALGQLGLNKLEAMVERPDGDNRVYSISVKSDLSVKRLAEDEELDSKLQALGYQISKPFIHAARLKSVVKDALEQGFDLTGLVETEQKVYVSFKEKNHG